MTQNAVGLGADWAAVALESDAGHLWRAAGISDGPPQDLRIRKPARTAGNPARGKFVQYFQWSKPPQAQVHLLCYYRDTTLIVYRALDGDPRQCELESSGDAGGARAPAVLRCD